MRKAPKVAVIGAGNMGEAIIAGLLKSGLFQAKDVRVVEVLEPRRKYISETYGVECVDIRKAVAFADVPIIVVEPKRLKEALEQLKPALTPGKVLVSVVAGVPLENYRRYLPKDVPVVRVLPNVTCIVREAVIGVCPSENTPKDKLEVISLVLGQLGQVSVVDEKFLNLMTGFVGSGPAYVSVMIEAMADAGVRLGIPKDKSLMMAAQTMLGTAKMVVERKEYPAKIKDKVATPGGITVEGLLELEKGGLRATIISAVGKALERTKEMERERQ